MEIKLPNILPEYPKFAEGIRRAPNRGFRLTKHQAALALSNALRYVPAELHEILAPEFMEELVSFGRIYAYRYRPQGRLYGKPIDEYTGKCIEGKAFQVMIDNNLDFEIALYPYELVTYGETGAVCQNWLQYRLIMLYLQNLTQDLTLVIQSGHPLGLFPSNPSAPRVIVTNGLLMGMFDNLTDFEIAAQMGVTNYGQMTAGGFMYIGPQGIVHGTYNTLLNAGRMKLGLGAGADLSGKLFVSSGLGGMSGAQPKAIEIANGVGIIAEVDPSRIATRHKQGWVKAVCKTPKEAFELAKVYQDKGEPYSIAYDGNIVDLLEYACENNVHIDLLTDQTSCHDVYNGGYCPQISFEERTRLLTADRAEFARLVDESLKKHYAAIKTLTDRGTYFFDYGNSFLKALYDCGIKEISKNGTDEKDGFVYPSYVEDILGPELFDYGYGPFRWICLSGDPADLRKTDAAAKALIDPNRRPADRDNYVWIEDAEKNALVVGTQARILYQDAEGRTAIALKLNEMVRRGEIGPVMLGRDHHDTGGTDSPFRETSNIKDGSNITADMATQSFAGNAARGMSLIALHNGGGVGIGKSVNGGFGLVLDGSKRIDAIIRDAMMWDVTCGVARRSWAKNPNAMETAALYNQNHDGHITLPYVADEGLVAKTIENVMK
ncbi:MAG: urocanate hydratase [Defluviitaleaceae bacterium]|nr:urocanate hydratase [Defluviitaleaceae bacterium]